jgi:hippurate hydrolase
MLLGAASLLVAEPPPRPVRLLWQPAEEKAAGALAMIAAGAMEGVGRIFGGHIDPRYPTGVLVVTEGAVNASTDNFFIEITGRGGHGARPHEAVDAVVVGGLLVTALQTVVSRVVDPAHPAVISVGSFHAGTAPNVIAGRAQLSGTLRAQKAAVREQLRAGVRRAAAGVGQVHGATIEVRIEEGTPPLINTPDATALAWAAAAEVVGPESVVPLRGANMGGEDFARYLDHAPGCYIRFGARPASGAEPAHSGRFDFDEGALACGAAWYDRVARLGGAI